MIIDEGMALGSAITEILEPPICHQMVCHARLSQVLTALGVPYGHRRDHVRCEVGLQDRDVIDGAREPEWLGLR